MATRNATRRVIESAFSNYVIREWSGLLLGIIDGAGSSGPGPEPQAISGIGYYWRKRRRRR